MESSPEPCTLFSSTPVQYLTVWRKSLLFNGHGYTVYDDADGSIVFRVEDYAHDWRRHALLMDRHGNVLLTVRRCRCNILNLWESWKAYKGDEDAQMITKGERRRPLFKAIKDLGSSSCTISMFTEQGSPRSPSLGYRMSWSRTKEWFTIYQVAPINTLVAEASRKYGSSTPMKLLDKDVLALRVFPGMDRALAMAMIMITNSMR
ncbi:protein LURP-one-related 5-like [Zingiber officinale]|uniref:protein LURP-one-related 5-like n=1 Tax=Zingiber officinale TaxID=94328 RepID=UPI001C4C7183|nr:protein LURP-one-related 5-like [Zingiber officinale]